jgi:hypothetical protein
MLCFVPDVRFGSKAAATSECDRVRFGPKANSRTATTEETIADDGSTGANGGIRLGVVRLQHPSRKHDHGG